MGINTDRDRAIEILSSDRRLCERIADLREEGFLAIAVHNRAAISVLGVGEIKLDIRSDGRLLPA